MALALRQAPQRLGTFDSFAHRARIRHQREGIGVHRGSCHSLGLLLLVVRWKRRCNHCGRWPGYVTSGAFVTPCRTVSRTGCRLRRVGTIAFMPFMPPFIAPTRHSDPESALAQVRTIYNQQIQHLREAMQRFIAGESLPGYVRACYPIVRIHTETVTRPNSLVNSAWGTVFSAA